MSAVNMRALPDSGGLILMKFFRNTYYLFIALLQHKQVIISIIYVVYIQFNESPTPTSPTILPEAPQNGFLNQHLMQVKMGMIVLLHIERCSLKLVFHFTLPASVWTRPGEKCPRLLFLSRREEMGTYTAGCFQSIHQFIFKIDVIPSPNFHEICEPIRWVSERLQDVAQDMERK